MNPFEAPGFGMQFVGMWLIDAFCRSVCMVSGHKYGEARPGSPFLICERCLRFQRPA